MFLAIIFKSHQKIPGLKWGATYRLWPGGSNKRCFNIVNQNIVEIFIENWKCPKIMQRPDIYFLDFKLFAETAYEELC